MATGLGLGCGIAAVFVVHCDNNLAQILVQFGGALLVATTLFYQYVTTQMEFNHYHADKFRELFQRNMTLLAEAVDFLKTESIFEDMTLHSVEVISDLLVNYDIICSLLSAEDGRYFIDGYYEWLYDAKSRAEERAEHHFGPIDQAILDEVSNARSQVEEYERVQKIRSFYQITKEMWEASHKQSERQIALQAMRILLQRHQGLLNRLFFAYATLDTFFQQYSTNAVVKEDGATSLLSKFSGDELRFFFLWAEYTKASGLPSPSILYELLKEASAKYPIA